MKDYKNLLTIKRDSYIHKNKLCIYVEWDSNDGDYIGNRLEINPNILFKNKKLIYCLAYAILPYNFKGHDWNDHVFQHHVSDNQDIIGLEQIISDNGFMCYSDWGPCHSLMTLIISYYDEEGIQYVVTFEDIHNHWKNMTYNEICDEINGIEWMDPYEEKEENINSESNLYPLRPAGS